MNRCYDTSDDMLKMRPAFKDEDIYRKVARKGQLTLASVEDENIRLLCAERMDWIVSVRQKKIKKQCRNLIM